MSAARFNEDELQRCSLTVFVDLLHTATVAECQGERIVTNIYHSKHPSAEAHASQEATVTFLPKVLTTQRTETHELPITSNEFRQLAREHKKLTASPLKYALFPGRSHEVNCLSASHGQLKQLAHLRGLKLDRPINLFNRDIFTHHDVSRAMTQIKADQQRAMVQPTGIGSRLRGTE